MAMVWSNGCKLLGPPPYSWGERTSLATNAMLIAIRGECGIGQDFFGRFCVLHDGHGGEHYTCPHGFYVCVGEDCPKINGEAL